MRKTALTNRFVSERREMSLPRRYLDCFSMGAGSAVDEAFRWLCGKGSGGDFLKKSENRMYRKLLVPKGGLDPPRFYPPDPKFTSNELSAV